eukprot:2236325-Pyramimonas_sp.AAC.1
MFGLSWFLNRSIARAQQSALCGLCREPLLTNALRPWQPRSGPLAKCPDLQAIVPLATIGV